ncbi:TPA: hypothetical protein ACYQQY_005290, partial [Escherichia coli]
KGQVWNRLSSEKKLKRYGISVVMVVFILMGPLVKLFRLLIASCRVNCALICIPGKEKSMEPEIPAMTGTLMNAVRD